MNSYGALTDKLPSPLKNKSVKANKQNIFEILIDKENNIFVKGKRIEISELKPMVRSFLLETSDKKEIELPLVGKQKISKGVVLLNTNRRTSYNFYISVQDELISVFTDIRNDYSHKFFKLNFDNLDKNKKQIIEKLAPLSISEAEPSM